MAYHKEAGECHEAFGKPRLCAGVRVRRGEPQAKEHDEEAKILERHHGHVEDNLGFVNFEDGHRGERRGYRVRDEAGFARQK